jgi:eukaryotic-like serine/threonine-protein kinase
VTEFDTVATGSRPIGGYETLLELGSGGMGTAYLARAVGPAGFERLVVIKRLLPQMLKRPEAVARFLDEARLAACILHANVVSTHQVGHDEEGYFLVLEYVEGASLEELVDRAALKGETIPPPIALRIALDACSGLHAAHTARDSSGRPLELLHRDISLQNLLVGRDGVARVVDFGVAKSALGSVITDEGFVLGKLLYMAPEYLRHEPPGPDLDVYSLGVTLFIALAGRDPWPTASDNEIVGHLLTEGMPPLSSAMDVPPQIDDLVNRACNPTRSARFRTARAMADHIEAIGRDTGWLASHGDVADYVERLAGTDLERRRAAISRREIELGVSEPPTAAIPLTRRSPDETETLAAQSVTIRPKKRVLWPVGIAMVVVSAIAGAVVVRMNAPTPAVADTVGTAAPSANSLGTPAPAVTPVETAAELPAPAPSASVAEPLPGRSAHPKTPPLREPPRPALVKSVQPANPPAPPPPVEPTSGISKRNPYRHP